MPRKGQSNGAWVRLYVKALDSEKIDRLSDKTFRFWVKLMLVAKENDGVLPSLSSISWRTRDKVKAISDSYNELVEAGLVEVDPSGDSLHNWEDYQPHSDVSTERVRKHRNARRPATETVQDGTNETVSVTHISEEKRREENPPIVPRSGDVPQLTLLPDPPPSKPARKRRGDVELVAWKQAKFEEFWDCVWAKIGKEPARGAWDVACVSPEVADRIIAACKRAAPRELAKGQRNNGSYLHPSTWLNQKRYNDEGPPEAIAHAEASKSPFAAPYQITPPTGGYNPADYYRPLPEYADWQSEEEPDGAA